MKFKEHYIERKGNNYKNVSQSEKMLKYKYNSPVVDSREIVQQSFVGIVRKVREITRGWPDKSNNSWPLFSCQLFHYRFILLLGRHLCEQSDRNFSFLDLEKTIIVQCTYSVQCCIQFLKEKRTKNWDWNWRLFITVDPVKHKKLNEEVAKKQEDNEK